MTNQNWFLRYKKIYTQGRVYCFHHAGGSASSFFGLQQALSHTPIEVFSMQLPGRSTRIDEPGCPSFEEMLSHLEECMMEDFLPFVFLGQSFGGIIAYELAKRLVHSQKILPRNLIITSCIPPQYMKELKKYSHLPDEEFLKSIENDFGSMPQELKSSKDLLSLAIQILKADFNFIDHYTFEHDAPLSIPITVLEGSDDSSIRPYSLKDWQERSTFPLEYSLHKGDHFFPYSKPDLIASYICNKFDLIKSSSRGQLSGN